MPADGNDLPALNAPVGAHGGAEPSHRILHRDLNDEPQRAILSLLERLPRRDAARGEARTGGPARGRPNRVWR